MKEKKNEDRLRDIWDNIKCTSIHISEVSEEESEKGPKKIFEEKIAENFPNMGKEIVNQVQEAQKIPDRINPRRNTPRHMIIKMMKIKDKDKILKSAREKNDKTQENSHKVFSWFFFFFLIEMLF